MDDIEIRSDLPPPDHPDWNRPQKEAPVLDLKTGS